MKKFINANKKLLSVVLMCLLVLVCANTNTVYASTKSKNLKNLLEKHEDDLGDLKQLKEVMDMIHEDLYNATKVNNSLKQKLSSDIDKFNNMVGINPLIKTSISTELKAQTRDLSDENIDETKENVLAIKEWVDYKVGDTLDADDSDEEDLNDDSEDNSDNEDEEDLNDDDSEDNSDNEDDLNDDDSEDNSDNEDEEQDDTEESPDDENEEEPSDDEDSNDEIDEVEQESPIIDKSLVGQSLPKAGIKSTIIAISIILLIGAVFFIIRYRQLDDFIK